MVQNYWKNAKYLHNFSGVLKIPLINYEINLVPNWSVTYITYNAAANQAVPFEITDTKLHVPVVTLSTQDNAKLLQQSKSGFKRKTNWNKCQSEVTVKRQNRYSDYLIDPRYQGVNTFYHFQTAQLEQNTEDVFFQMYK